MLRLPPRLSLWALSILMGCGTKTTAVVTECGEGMGRADDGICYPLAGYGEDGTTTATEDSGSNGDGSGSSGDGSGSSGDGSGSSGDGSGSSDDGASGSDDGSGGNSDGETGSSSGVSIQISGVIVFDATTSSSANCNISSWVAEAVNEPLPWP